MDCRTALLTVLDQVDYTNGACRLNEMVGAVLPKEVIVLARKAIADEAAQQSVQADKCPHCQHGLIVLQDKSIIDCIACGSTGIRR
jgi:hypothetical protein